MTLTIEQLTQALKDAALEHHVFETANGSPDANWQKWYAEYIAARFPNPIVSQPVASCPTCAQPSAFNWAIDWKPLPSETPLDAPPDATYSYHAQAHNAYDPKDNASGWTAQDDQDRIDAGHGVSL